MHHVIIDYFRLLSFLNAIVFCLVFCLFLFGFLYCCSCCYYYYYIIIIINIINIIIIIIIIIIVGLFLCLFVIVFA